MGVKIKYINWHSDPMVALTTWLFNCTYFMPSDLTIDGTSCWIDAQGEMTLHYPAQLG